MNEEFLNRVEPNSTERRYPRLTGASIQSIREANSTFVLFCKGWLAQTVYYTFWKLVIIREKIFWTNSSTGNANGESAIENAPFHNPN